MQNTGKKTISRSFLTGLLIIVLVGFVASIGFSWMLQTRLSNENAAELLRINIKDVKLNILDASDKNLLELAHEVADSLDNGLNTSPGAPSPCPYRGRGLPGRPRALHSARRLRWYRGVAAGGMRVPSAVS